MSRDSDAANPDASRPVSGAPTTILLAAPGPPPRGRRPWSLRRSAETRYEARKPVARIVWAHTVRSPCHLRPCRPAAGSIPSSFRTFQAGAARACSPDRPVRRGCADSPGCVAAAISSAISRTIRRTRKRPGRRCRRHHRRVGRDLGATVELVFGTKRELLKTWWISPPPVTTSRSR